MPVNQGVTVLVAIVRKNISTYFYPEDYQSELFVPFGVVDNNKITMPDGSTAAVPSTGINGIPVEPATGHPFKVSFSVVERRLVCKLNDRMDRRSP